ncbi:MAG: DegT/DnrJ/EryC1/StrS family aminotransferase [Candidatus Beckwithbacteria bacterium]|nr:DegT/DnrJ/EryC1/StrS family aminotransferase [Candidatus Beckwithbacteria bacterium]
MSKPILISLSPNTDRTDVFLALRLLFEPWRWQKGDALTKLTTTLKQYFKRPYCYLVNAARSALYLGLKSLNLNSKDEVLYQEFTCKVVPQAIIKAGATPIAVDNNSHDFNLNIQDLTKKITSRSKAVIIQHTFGNPDDLISIQSLCHQHNLVLIEDCAHSLGVKYQGKPIGSFGDLTILSFGRDKVISSVFGGALLSQKHLSIPNLSYPSYCWIAKQLLHPVIFSIAVPTYFSLGKIIIGLCRALKLITLPLLDLPVQLLPNALAELVLHQWKKLDQLNRHRQAIAKAYASAFKQKFNPAATYLRFPLEVGDPAGLIRYAKTKHVWLGDWYDKKIVNLPTHSKMDLTDADRVIKIVKRYVDR